MIKEFFLLTIIIIIKCECSREKLDFFQTDYDVTMDIAEITSYNKSIIKNPKLGFDPYNRTQRVLNTTFELLIDLSSDLIEDVQMYKFMSNEYRFFPVTFKANVCEIYMNNSFGIKDTLSRTSNILPCNFKKGTYYIRNTIPDFSKLPPHMPHGSYKMVVEFSFRSIFCGQINAYGSVKEKPVDWEKIPNHKSKMH